MRKLNILLILITCTCSLFGQTKNSEKVHYDGVYQTIFSIGKKEYETASTFIRFYPDGTVISATSVGQLEDVIKWLHVASKNILTGKYQIRRKKIRFSITGEEGTVSYKGKIADQHQLLLKWKSKINGRKGREKYQFFQVKGLK